MRSSLLRFFFLALGVGLFGSRASAQAPTQVIVANGGVFGPNNFASIASWDIVNDTYTVLDSVPASSVQDLIIEGDTAYLAADSFLVKYDLAGRQRLATAPLSGVRKLAIYQDKLLVTRGFGASSDWVQAFNKSDLTFDYAVSGISGQCEGIATFQDTAFVAVPGSFGNTTGDLAVIDLTNGQLVREISFDTFGVGISRVIQFGDDIWTVSPLAFGSPAGYISRYTVANAQLQHFRENFSLRNGVTNGDGNIYLTANGNLASYNMQGAFFLSTNVVSGNWQAIAADAVNGDYFLTATDFATFGRLYRYSSMGMVIDSVEVGISPEAIALYTPLPISAESATEAVSDVTFWPNPTASTLYLQRRGNGAATVEVRDLLGRNVVPETRLQQQAELNVDALPAGTYLLTIREKAGTQTKRFIKAAQ
ncbi:MAG: T9SS type A sorting domain-containing protein [Bacteroidota bacterium]